MKTSEQINEIAKALSLAQGQMRPAIFDKENSFFKTGGKGSRYASFTSIVNSIKEPLAANSLCVTQDVINGLNGAIGIVTTLIHASGQFMEFGPCFFNPKDQGAQGYGSAVSYGKRYCLSAALGVVADDDDDGNAATFGSAEKQPEKPKDVPPITEAQAKELKEMVDACGKKDQEILVDFMKTVCKTERITNLPANMYAGFMQQVEMRYKKLAQTPF